MADIKQTLLEAGLHKNEIDIFLAMLPLSKATVSDIGRRAGVKRTTVYQHLDALVQKGLIYKLSNGKRIYYKADNPHKIVAVFEKERRKIENRKKSIERALPDLETLYKDSFEQPHVSFYEGREGVLSAYKRMVETWQDVYQIFSPRSFFKIYSLDENDALLMRLKKHEVKLYNLMEKSPKASERLAISKYDKFVKTKVLPDNLSFDSDLLVADNRLLLVSFDNLVAAMIQDSSIANMQRTFLRYIWDTI